ncbi:MAG: hypothetical protein WBQ32_12035, partial [Ignavibacteriaceae bacterium]
MKKIFVTLVTFAVFFTTGCQENLINDPVESDSASKTQNSVKHGVIEFQKLLTDPYPIGNSYYLISGGIEYQQSITSTSSQQPSARKYVSVQLSINADLKYFCSVCSPSEEDVLAGYLQETSTEEYLLIDSHYLVQFDKTFVIQGRDDGMVLKCKFNANINGIELSAMWLVLDNK